MMKQAPSAPTVNMSWVDMTVFQSVYGDAYICIDRDNITVT